MADDVLRHRRLLGVLAGVLTGRLRGYHRLGGHAKAIDCYRHSALRHLEQPDVRAEQNTLSPDCDTSVWPVVECRAR
ncbi:hypothetical protein [Streptomyces sp. NPDC004728]|uniref:hypothetical protein n=1 Tax=Streptomyces sp. NPDC004728 TaxID=3154289 RepID=UPI0033A37ADC